MVQINLPTRKKTKIKRLSSETLIKEFSNKTLKDVIVIEGLWGLGRIAQWSVGYILKQKNAEKLLEFYSGYLGHFLLPTDEGKGELPRYELYHINNNNDDFIFLYSEVVQPSSEIGNFILTYNIFEEILKRYKPKLVITIGGLLLQEELTRKPSENIYYICTHPEIEEELKKLNFENLHPTPKDFGMVVGAAGLLYGFAQLHEIPAICFLAEIMDQWADIRGTKRILELLDRMFNFNLDMQEINEELKREEEEWKKLIKKLEEIQQSIKEKKDKYRI